MPRIGSLFVDDTGGKDAQDPGDVEVAALTAQVLSNTATGGANAVAIGVNAANIVTNTANIATNMSDISGLDTRLDDIEDGIDAISVGAVTPAAGTFTSLSTNGTGPVSLNTTGTQAVNIGAATGAGTAVTIQAGTALPISIGTTGSRTGAINMGIGLAAGGQVNVGTTDTGTARLRGSLVEIANDSSGGNITLGSSGGGSSQTVSIGVGATHSGPINIGTGPTRSGAVNIATGGGTTGSVSIRTAAASGGLFLGTANIGTTTLEGATVTIASVRGNTLNLGFSGNAASDAGVINIGVGTDRGDLINIGNGVGNHQVNIGSVGGVGGVVLNMPVSGAHTRIVRDPTSGVCELEASDERLKKDITDADTSVALDTINALRVRRYCFKTNDELNADRQGLGETVVISLGTENCGQIGFIAQEVQPVLPEAAFGTPDGETAMSLADPPIVATLVAAVQELTTRVAALEAV